MRSDREARNGLRQRLVVEPADPAATMDAEWPPRTRSELARCARAIRRAMLLLESLPVADKPLASLLLRRRYWLNELLKHIRYRAGQYPAAETWSVQTRSGQSIRLPLIDGPARAFREIAAGYEGGFEHALHDYVTGHLRAGDVFVDVGAHVGYTSAFAASTGASVFAIEMQRDLIPLIERLALLNGFDRLRVLHAGASAAPGLAALERMLPHPGYQLSNRRPDDAVDPSPASIINDFVPLVTLDDLFGREALLPAMVKIDVEGHELSVLEGSRRIIAEARTTFIVEFHPHIVAALGRSADQLFALFPGDRWEWWQLTDIALHPLAGPAAIQADPRDPNPKLVFRPAAVPADGN